MGGGQVNVDRRFDPRLIVESTVILGILVDLLMGFLPKKLVDCRLTW